MCVRAGNSHCSLFQPSSFWLLNHAQNPKHHTERRERERGGRHGKQSAADLISKKNCEYLKQTVEKFRILERTWRCIAVCVRCCCCFFSALLLDSSHLLTWFPEYWMRQSKSITAIEYLLIYHVELLDAFGRLWYWKIAGPTSSNIFEWKMTPNERNACTQAAEDTHTHTSQWKWNGKKNRLVLIRTRKIDFSAIYKLIAMSTSMQFTLSTSLIQLFAFFEFVHFDLILAFHFITHELYIISLIKWNKSLFYQQISLAPSLSLSLARSLSLALLVLLLLLFRAFATNSKNAPRTKIRMKQSATRNKKLNVCSFIFVNNLNRMRWKNSDLRELVSVYVWRCNDEKFSSLALFAHSAACVFL